MLLFHRPARRGRKVLSRKRGDSGGGEGRAERAIAYIEFGEEDGEREELEEEEEKGDIFWTASSLPSLRGQRSTSKERGDAN